MDVAKKSRNTHNFHDFSELLVSVRRVAKVVKGGRRFSFSVLVVVGDEKGRVGCGMGKHAEVAEAKVKAVNAARKNMIRVHLRESRTLHHDVKAKFCASKVILRSAKVGTGIIAGGSVRLIFEVLGVQDVVAKSIGSSNPHNVIYAVFTAFKNMLSPKQVASKRNRKIVEIIENR
ncbi:30S ribosomal protein S5 [Neoehrlichia mikurensis]|uniref:Small ribosomal subunit protein uS5 n=1 Tax=Neoehrlichia mikurensis TaxID=89586 RepID=A0A9Q9F441_9RICK|nr:30S ribosomal protein S5 [Neoehrlichia mikurensis]QXK91807.1 30S ribosomal protein S5 [Neoehrlichia mikurensis]QXK93020.1 30S ribosomal protein S5 [Neoehrlichia mikurensis]QXK93498.1 30S ribosomal protein S5 [Neoehrlichia mikurensis]UTO55548.1 30S ribosomal protein S5 [Neoehrlichia mikurensis]UTO56469.1 30S ribosomal protein S5 [Neoehrlichia mikurensis]